MLRKDDREWVKKCADIVVDGVRPRGRLKRTWKEVVEGYIQYMKSLKLSKEDTLVCSKWRLIRGTEENSDDSGVNVSDCVTWFTWIKGL